MAQVPPVQPPLPGQYSPDGLWQWDGQNWVPIRAAAAPRRSSLRWIWWLVGGCAVLAVLAIVGIVLGAASLFSAFHSASACLPSDFPQYPGATETSFNTYAGTGVAPGDTHRCTITLESNDDAPTVTAFYTDRLNSGDWTLDSNDPTTGEITFHLNSRHATIGKIDFLARGQHTEIQIVLDS